MCGVAAVYSDLYSECRLEYSGIIRGGSSSCSEVDLSEEDLSLERVEVDPEELRLWV